MAGGDYARYRHEEVAAGRQPVTLSAWQKRERKRKNPPIITPRRRTDMNREYAPLYVSATQTWMVIFKDWNESSWYVEVPDAGSKDNAELLAEALNARTSA